MTVPEILEALSTATGKFPQAALEAAVAQREEITPHLLQSLQDLIDDPAGVIERHSILHEFAVYLLAQFREPGAYPLLAKLLMVCGEVADDLFGDTLTEGFNRILATLFDGDLTPIKTLVESNEPDEFARGAAVEALVILVHTGRLTREAAVEYFRELFQGKLPRAHSQVWNALACSVADLPAPELLGELQKAYEEGLVDPGYANFEELKHGAMEAPEAKLEELGYSLVDDAVEEIGAWPWRQSAPAYPPFRPWDPSRPNPSTAFRAGPKIGRNDPCPCGSGRKYKKCCLDKS